LRLQWPACTQPAVRRTGIARAESPDGECRATPCCAIALGDQWDFHLGRRQLLVRSRPYKDALSDLDLAVAGAPTDGETYLWRGVARLGLWTQTARVDRDVGNGALTDFQQAVVLDPTDTVALDRFAWLNARRH
jgi:hypothetical protein